MSTHRTPSCPLIDRSLASNVQTYKMPTRGKIVAAVVLVFVLAVSFVCTGMFTSVSEDRLSGRTYADFDTDVRVDSINSPSGTIEPGEVTVNATVSNCGNLPSGDFQVNLTVIETGVPERVFTDSFETGSVPPPGWTDYSWKTQLWLTTTSSPHSGIRCLYSGQEIYGSALLGSPAIDVSDGSVLEFWVRYSNSGSLSVLYVNVSTVGHAWADLVTSPDATLAALNTSATGGLATVWTQYSCDLSAFAGETVYVGFNHFQPLYGYILYLDDVNVTSPTGITYVRNETVSVSSLDAGSSAYIEFSPWTAGEGDYSIYVNTYLVGDMDPTNDAMSADIVVEQVVIPEFSGILAPVIATVLVLFSVRTRARRRG